MGREWFKKEIYAKEREKEKEKEKNNEEKEQLKSTETEICTPPSSRQQSQDTIDLDSCPTVIPIKSSQSPKRRRNSNSPSISKQRRSIKGESEESEAKETREPKRRKKQSSDGNILQFFTKRSSNYNVCSLRMKFITHKRKTNKKNPFS